MSLSFKKQFILYVNLKSKSRHGVSFVTEQEMDEIAETRAGWNFLGDSMKRHLGSGVAI